LPLPSQASGSEGFTECTSSIRMAASPVTRAGKFYMRKRGAHSNKVNGSAINVTAAATGQIEYRWASADVNTAGTYDCEIEVTRSSKLLTTERFVLVIREGLG